MRHGHDQERQSDGTTRQPVSDDFVLVETSSFLGDVEPEKHKLNDLIISGLRQRQSFGNVSGNKTDAGSDHGIEVKVEITEIKKVSDNLRAWFGALAGRAQISVAVTVSDLTTGQVIQTFEAEGESGKSAKAGTTDQAIEQAAGQIVAEIMRINMATSP